MTLLTVATAAIAALVLGLFLVARFSAPAPRGWRLYEFLLLWHTMTWLGASIVALLDPTALTIQFCMIVSVSQISCSVGALVGLARTSARAIPLPARMSSTEQSIALGVAAVAACICLIFVYTVIYNEQLALMLASVITGEGEFLDYRLTMSTGGAVYLAPGYVKQFRDVLLPAAILTFAVFASTPKRWVVLALGVIGTAAALLSGERSVLMIYVFTFGAVFYLRPGRSTRTRWLVPTIVACAVFAAFIGSTMLLGRADADSSVASLLATSAGSLFDRVVLTVPRENALGMSVWGPMSPTWGRTWLADLAGILPGVQTGLSNELHELLGGGPSGSAPLGLPADIYLAWGIGGVAIVPFLFSLMIQAVDELLLASNLALLRVLRITIVPLTFNWFSPFLFILNGGVVLIAAAIAARAVRRD